MNEVKKQVFCSFLSSTQTQQFYQILCASHKPGQNSPNATTERNFFLAYKVPKVRNESQLFPIFYRRCFSCCDSPSGSRPPFWWGLEITVRHATFSGPPLDDWSYRRRDVCLTTHNYHERQTSMPLVEFESTIPPSQRSQNHALPRAATGIGRADFTKLLISVIYRLLVSRRKKITIYFKTSKRISEYSDTWMSYLCLQECRH